MPSQQPLLHEDAVPPVLGGGKLLGPPRAVPGGPDHLGAVDGDEPLNRVADEHERHQRLDSLLRRRRGKKKQFT